MPLHAKYRYNILFTQLCMRLCIGMCTWVKVPMKARRGCWIQPLGARVICICELTNKSARNWTQTLWKSSRCSELPSSRSLSSCITSFEWDKEERVRGFLQPSWAMVPEAVTKCLTKHRTIWVCPRSSELRLVTYSSFPTWKPLYYPFFSPGTLQGWERDK